MNKFSKIIAWAYLVVGIVFIIEVFVNWNIDRQKSWVSLLMAALAIFMFFFKRRYRNKRFEK
ncbi:hypothetical protein [Ochrovirga pacifica]|uniref:hypothetical protein n=1 Tax=Ochrovirga pacifica TaxID=1042376 RepID=UPI0002557FB5|nr:hypothetical protein [Ochrovirga pacifica]